MNDLVSIRKMRRPSVAGEDALLTDFAAAVLETGIGFGEDVTSSVVTADDFFRGDNESV